MFWRKWKKQPKVTNAQFQDLRKCVLQLQEMWASQQNEVKDIQNQLDIVADQCGVNEAAIATHLDPEPDTVERNIFAAFDNDEIHEITEDELTV